MSDHDGNLPKDRLMSQAEGAWLAENWHKVNDIGDAEEREEWRRTTRLRKLGIDPDASEFDIYLQLRRRRDEIDKSRKS